MVLNCPKCKNGTLDYDFQSRQWRCLWSSCIYKEPNKYLNPLIVSTMGLETAIYKCVICDSIDIEKQGFVCVAGKFQGYLCINHYDGKLLEAICEKLEINHFMQKIKD